MEPGRLRVPASRTPELREVGQKVLARTRDKIRGAGSGIEIEFLAWAVWTFNEAGRTIRLEIYLEHEEAEALEAAGLSE